MTLGELLDELNDRISTGEFNRLDGVYVEGGEEDSDHHPLIDISAAGGPSVILQINARIGDNQWGL